jgi:Pentapeptide repeats (8 copies)
MSRRLYVLWAARSLWWPLPAALAIIAAQQGLRRVGWMRLGDAAATAGRVIWSMLVVGWPLLIATVVIVWQVRRARAAPQRESSDDQTAPPQRRKRQRRVRLGLSATAAGLFVLGAVLILLPILLVPAGAINNANELYKARNDVRGTLVQVLAGGLVATGLVFTARTLDLNRSGQVTERFTRAVDQLGQREPGKLDVRLGGIYALERIGRDSAADLPTVVEVLCAHVREYSPWPPRLPGQGRADIPTDQLMALPELQTRAPDLQAVLTVLGRLPHVHPSRPGRARAADPARIDLSRTDLRRADLTDAHLEWANLIDAHLQGAFLIDAHLDRAYLFNAHLQGAFLVDAHLQGAQLNNAHLEGADLTYAHLEGADLGGAHLELANLHGAHLEGASLDSAELRGALANETTVWPVDFDWQGAGVRMAIHTP